MQLSRDSRSIAESNTKFVVKPVYSGGGGPSEFRQSMQSHPLVHQELAHDPSFGVYNRRLRSLQYGNVRAEDLYWRLRRQVGLSHTGELATEISGPDAEALLNVVFTRDVSKVRVGRCSYQIACLYDGGTLMDGVLLRLAADRFWYAQGDGEFPVWLRAHAKDYDVKIFDPKIWISQVQGPRSMDVLAKVSDSGIPEKFRYFDLAEITIAGQPVVISRTGFTNELGWEFYFHESVDADAIGESILKAGEAYDIHTIPAAATNARRIEGGLMFSGTDFDESVNPFEAGLGALIDFDKENFIGKEALEKADKHCRTWGLKCKDGVARQGDFIFLDEQQKGTVLSSAWSPFIEKGVAICRFKDASLTPGLKVQVECVDGLLHEAEVCELPMYDKAGDIPRGKYTEIPEIPPELTFTDKLSVS